MKALVLSGGKGQRLEPYSFTQAKQLFPLANRPILERVIEAIRDAGIREVGVVVGETGDQIRNALGSGASWDLSITYISQEYPAGLAHAIKISHDFLGEERFLMSLGDNLIEGGISGLVQSFERNNWNSQVVLKEVRDSSRFGVAVLREDGSIDHLVEKPFRPPSNLALVGVYMFDQYVFEAVNAIQPSPRGELEIVDAIQWLIDHRHNVHTHIHQGWWIDTGKANDLLEANRLVLTSLRSSIAHDAELENSQIDNNVTVQSGARVINSIVRGPTIIGQNSLIMNAYVGPQTSISHGVTIEDAEIERSVVLDQSIIRNIGPRIKDALIGRSANLQTRNDRSGVMTINLADHSSLVAGPELALHKASNDTIRNLPSTTESDVGERLSPERSEEDLVAETLGQLQRVLERVANWSDEQQYEVRELVRESPLGRMLLEEVQQQYEELVGVIQSEWIEPAEINSAFDSVVEKKWPNREGKPGRRPVRLQRIRDVVLGRENEDITLEELAEAFSVSSKNPRKEASNAVSWLNCTFKELGVDLQFEGHTTTRCGESTTIFHFRRSRSA